MERGGRKLCTLFMECLQEYFWNPASTVLEWEREPVLGSDGWDQMRRKIPNYPRKVLGRIQFGKLQIHWSELAVPYVTYLWYANWTASLNRAREVWNIFI